MKTARIIVTRDCPRKCSYCCSNDGNLAKNHAGHVSVEAMLNFSADTNYDAFVITGGEPMLYRHKVVDFVGRLRNYNPYAKFYLHTAWWPCGGGGLVARAFDGVNYTIHAEADEKDMECFLEATDCLSGYPGKTNRLVVHPEIADAEDSCFSHIDRHVWPKIEIMNPLPPDNCPIPENEDLYVLEGF
jgi:pyruvate-formate lyase-activating enzyme